MSQQQQQQERKQQPYALVNRSKPFTLPCKIPHGEARDDDDDLQQQQQHTATLLADELRSIYQSFAEMYPNPKLMEEIQERETLWAAAMAAAEAARRSSSSAATGETLTSTTTTSSSSTASQQQQQQQKISWWSKWLFGTTTKSNSTLGNSSTLTVDDVLEFIDIMDDDVKGIHDPQSLLCGTQFTLDPTCIPQEAHALARFHAACASPAVVRRSSSSTTTTNRCPYVVVRNVADAIPLSQQQKNTMIIIGLGTILEFSTCPSNDDDAAATSTNGDNPNSQLHECEGHITYTSDREDLKDFINDVAGATTTMAGAAFDVSHVRAAMVGNHLLAISWGIAMDGGVVMLYRRRCVGNVASSSSSTSSSPTSFVVGWEPVAMTSPTPAVVRNMLKSDDPFLHDDDEGHTTTTRSNLLRVTDIVPLVVDGPLSSLDDSSDENIITDDDEVRRRRPATAEAAACLAIGRLGGYIEIVPIPSSLWWSEPSTLHNNNNNNNNKRSQPTASSRKRKRRQQQHRRQRRPTDPLEHYATGKYADITSTSITVALTTCDYHVDLICLQVLPTTVDSTTTTTRHWDKNAYPNSPPAQFILAASGSSQDGSETISFWAVSTLSSPQQQQQSAANKDLGIGFSIHAALLEAVDIGHVGADITIFANNAIMTHWRRPRHVQLKQTSNNSNIHPGTIIPTNEEEHNTASGTSPHRITTLSLSAPIVSMRFGNTMSTDKDSSVTTTNLLLAVSDWNGGVCILDCSRLGRLATQVLAPEEYELMHNQDENADPMPLVTMLFNRSQVRKMLSGRNIMDVDWLPTRGQHDDPARLVIVSSNPFPALETLDIHITTTDSTRTDLTRSNVVPIPKIVSLVFTGRLNDVGLSLVAWQERNIRNVPNRTLFLCSMQTVEPKAVVESLYRSGKFQEAVDSTKGAAVNISEDVMNVLDLCHKRLWEQNHNLLHLINIADDAYVVDQALSILDDDNSEGRKLDIETVRLACLLALKKAENARLALALKLGGTDGTKTIVSSLRQGAIKIGTYLLLCRHLRVEGTYSRFQTGFWDVPISKLALAFAHNADVKALTIIIFRHKKQIGLDLFDILHGIPISMSPISFLHLLPVVSKTDEALIMQDDGKLSRLDFASLPVFMSKTAGLDMAIDPDDEKVLLDENTAMCVDEKYASLAASFYTARAKYATEFLGDFHAFTEFCEIGLQAFGVDPQQLHRNNTDIIPVLAKDLFLDWVCAISVQNTTIEVGDLTQRRLPNRETVQIDALRRMNVDEITSLFLDGVNHFQVAATVNKHLRPLLGALTATLTNNDDIDDKLEDALVSYMSRLLESCRSQDVHKRESTLLALQKRLTLCHAISRASKTTIKRQDRVIKNTRKLHEMIRIATLRGLRAVHGVTTRSPVCEDIMETMWGMYESLPSQIPPTAISDETTFSMHRDIDNLFRALVVVDITSRWPGCDFLESLTHILDSREQNESQHDRPEPTELGLAIISGIFRSFTTEVVKKTMNGTRSRTDLVEDIISDVKELNSNSFNGILPVSAVTNRLLVQPLLHEKQFQILAELLSRSPEAWFDRCELIGSVESFVVEAVEPSSEGMVPRANRPSFHEVIACQDVLGPHVPELGSRFQSIRRELDAVHFIENILMRGHAAHQKFDLQFLRSQLPLDVVESILLENPLCIFHGCREWADPKFALNTNATIRELKTTSVTPSNVSTPPPPHPLLPGGSIFQLATILGLDDTVSAFVVKSRVVHHCIASGCSGAGAAICRTLLDRDKVHADCDVMDRVCVRTVADVIGGDSYLDYETKHELGKPAVRIYAGCVPFSVRGEMDLIVKAVLSLEEKMTEKRRGHRVADRIYRDIKAQYATDIFDLFATLTTNAANNLVDNTLLNALCRFVIFWCITESTTSQAFDSALDSNLREQLALGASLLMHLSETSVAISNVDEFQSILSSQLAAQRGRPTKQNDVVRFDLSVVQKLRGRGYSENGARRAAIMAKNDVDKALVWAVSHSLDPNFDEPIVVLKETNLEPSFDKGRVRLVEDTLDYVRQLITGSVSMRVLSPASKDLTTPQEQGAPDSLGITKKPTPKSHDSLSHESHVKIKTINQVRKITAGPALSPKLQTARKILTSPSELRRNHQPPKLAKAEANGGNNGTSVSREQSAFSQRRPIAYTRPQGSELDHVVHASASADQKVVTPRTDDSTDIPPDRSALRQQGQAVRQQAQIISSTGVSAEERRRLIEQGRRLLQKARDARSKESPSPTRLFSTPPASTATQSDVAFGSSDATSSMSVPAKLRTNKGKQEASSLDRDNHDSQSGADGWDWDI